MGNNHLIEFLTSAELSKLEAKIIRLWEDFAFDKCPCFLQIRKNIINEYTLAHQEELLPHIVRFNEDLLFAMRQLYDKAHSAWDKMVAVRNEWPDVKLSASLYLSCDYPALHPVQGEDRQDLWNVLCDGDCNPAYDDGANLSPLLFPNELSDGFDDFNGLACLPPNWNEGLDRKLTKDLRLCIGFHHLFDHTYFALTDFIYVRSFHPEIHIELSGEKW